MSHCLVYIVSMSTVTVPLRVSLHLGSNSYKNASQSDRAYAGVVDFGDNILSMWKCEIRMLF